MWSAMGDGGMLELPLLCDLLALKACWYKELILADFNAHTRGLRHVLLTHPYSCWDQDPFSLFARHLRALCVLDWGGLR